MATAMRFNRLIAAALLALTAGSLAGCGGGTGFDPSDLLDFLDTKKKLPGERKPVFPQGVPGLEPGVPRDLYRGSRAEPEGEPAPAVQAAPEEPRGRKAAKSASRSAPRPAPARRAAPASAAEPEIAPDDVSVETPPPVVETPPPAARAKTTRRRTTAPPADPAPAAQAPAPSNSAASQPRSAPGTFPAPLPSGTFSR
jgi:hypothetical protein